MQIFVDADACPVKEEAAKVAARHSLVIHYVSNSHMRLPFGANVKRVVVSDGADAADNWIAEHCAVGDIVVTADIPLASRAIKKGARVISHIGKPFTEDSIGMALAMRDLMAQLRETGEMRGNNPVFTPKDRSNFLQGLEHAIQLARRSGT
ncbi:MAG: YaiI/YqxD family protein [Aestuariivirga sp.]|nr:YaiI/YqxD family protein [Aestuariivirga sp.]